MLVAVLGAIMVDGVGDAAADDVDGDGGKDVGADGGYFDESKEVSVGENNEVFEADSVASL